MRLLSADSLTFSPPQTEQLNSSVMIISKVYDASYGYKRIDKSDWVLEFSFEQSEYSHNQRLSNNTFNLVEMYLQEQPQNKWPELIKDHAHRFSFPIVMLHLEDTELTEPSRKNVLSGEIVWRSVDKNTDYLYRRVGGSAYMIKMGLFDEPKTLNYLQSILILVLASLVAFAVLLWIYPLWRDLKKLGISAEAFGQGDFSVRAPLPSGSVLHSLARTFDSMAHRIQKLISSHKELTNAVSHELRTPIARLRFGMEMLQSSTDEADKARYMQSMNADIDELDQLVAELLTYARFDRDKPTLKFQRQEIAPWLSGVIKNMPYGKEHLSINYSIEPETLIHARFEPRLLARALGNLLQNAQRYAQSKTNVTFTHDNGFYQVSVDDDGPGIPETERELVFEAFKRLDVSRDRDTGGYGLGLAIVQRISQWHGGDIIAEDSPLGGARFVIRWPEEE